MSMSPDCRWGGGRGGGKERSKRKEEEKDKGRERERKRERKTQVRRLIKSRLFGDMLWSKEDTEGQGSLKVRGHALRRLL